MSRAYPTPSFDLFPLRLAFAGIFLGAILLLLPGHALGDQYTGLAHDDPKDLLPPADPCPASIGDVGFQPLPIWAGRATMPPLPAQLKPMGARPSVAVTPASATASAPAPVSPSLAPPAETPLVATAPAASVKAPSAPAPNPTLVAVSPFLQWIRANPQAAAVEARLQANNYHPPSPSAAPASDSPYWLPPMIESDTGTGTGGGSAAIYSTPQR
jgi:hypothetical protein